MATPRLAGGKSFTVTLEIQAFIELHQMDGAALNTAEEPISGPDGGSDSPPVVAVVQARLIELWRANPWIFGLGTVAIAFFITKGAWFVTTEFVRIVF